MSRKGIGMVGIILLLLLMASMFHFLLNPRIEIISEAEKIYLETMDKSGQVERISIDNAYDVTTLKQLFSQKTVVDKGFVFAEGGYRITFKLGKKIMHLYPYCGNLERIRVGEDGDNYYIFEHEQKKADKLRNTLNKYCNLKEYQGIYEW